MPDFNIYQPPGVYVEEELSSVINLVGVRPGKVAIIGPGRGFRLGSEAVTIPDDDESGSERPVELSQEGIIQASIEVRSQGGTLYEEDVHYTVSESDGVISITRVGYANDDSDAPLDEIDEGETVLVSYEYTEADYYQPQEFADFDDVQDHYGPALNQQTGAIASPISFAARFAFQNGARQLVLVATTGNVGDPVDPSELEAAYAKIAADQDIRIVVPLAVDVAATSGDGGNLSVIAQDLVNHVVGASEQGNFRVGILGAEKSVTYSAVELAADAGSPRVILAWPNRLNYFHGFTNQTIEVGGYYLAAAYAGRLISLQSQVPLTRKRIFGFSGFPSSMAQVMTRSTKDNWSSNGVAVTEVNRQGQMVVRHGVSTGSGSIQNREVSLVRARDTLVTLLQETVDGSGLIGSYINDDAPGRVKGVVAGVLELAVSNGTIVGYHDLKARQTPGDPSVIEVKFQYQPAYPLNYIVISFSVNTTTGETTLIEQATGV